MALTREQLDAAADHLSGVLSLSGTNKAMSYNAIVQACCVAFMNVAPENADVKSLAKRLMRERFDDSAPAKKLSGADDAGNGAGRPVPAPGAPAGVAQSQADQASTRHAGR